MANQTANKKLICLWKGCDCMFDETTAFQEHVNKHVHEQHQLELSHQGNNDDTVTAAAAEEEPNAKKAKMDHENEDNNKVIKKENRKVVCLAIEVWTDIFGFIKRIQLARSISFTTRLFRDICGPRLHGDRIDVHEVWAVTITSRERFDWSRPAEILMLNGINYGKELPFPTSPPPGYISGFHNIYIKFMDERVVEFMKLIAPRIVANGGVCIHLELETENLDEKQWASVNQLLHIFREEFPETNLHVQCSTIKHLQDMDNKMQSIRFFEIKETEIPLLMTMLATPRADGQQHVVILEDFQKSLAYKMVNAIRQEFLDSIYPLEHPFYVRILRRGLRNTKSEHNPRTKETLTITLIESGFLDICRHPTGQRYTLMTDANKRIQESHEHECKTSIYAMFENSDSDSD